MLPVVHHKFLLAPALSIALLILDLGSAFAAGPRPIEEITVTAQRIEESAGEVPMSLSAFNEAMIRDRQIIGLTDLHINIPNVTFTDRPGTSAGNMRIRGIGVIPLSFGAETPTSTHINEIPFPKLYAGLEIYDLERIEVLRGPQGTLYGRNATAGALNLITKRPSFEGINGYADLEYGDYDNQRFTGALNVPVADTFALRIAGMALQRDGYIENKAGGQIPGVDKDIDTRDQYALRITGSWKINDRADLWVMYDRFDEDARRNWQTSKICKQSTLPINLGCEPNQFGRDVAHPSASIFGLLMGFEGMIPLGARDAATGLQYDYPRPATLGSRETHRDGNFEYELEEEMWSFGFQWAFDQWHLDITGGYQKTDWRASGPNNTDIAAAGFRLGSTDENPSGLWPMSAFPGSPGFLRTGGECDVDAYQGGALGGCIASVDQTRGLAYVVNQDQLEYWSLEAKVRSRFDGPVNFLVGANYAFDEVFGEVVFLNNIGDMLSSQSIGGFPPAYPGFGFIEQAGNESESYAVFAELYWQLTDTVNVTLGFRYNKDEKRPNEASGVFAGSFDANFFLRPFGLDLGSEPLWIRGPLVPYLFNSLFAAPVTDDAISLAEYYGATDAIASANGLSELIDALQIVPPVERPGELRALSGLPSEIKYEEWSGRFVIDWLVNPNTLVYAKYNRGFKPGAVGSIGASDLDSEVIDSVEIGTKTRLLNDSISFNAAAFAYKYHDMQVGVVVGLAPEGRNVNVKGRGIELDAMWRPPGVPNLSVNLAYGWLDVELGNYTDIDFQDRLQGNADFILLSSFDAFGGNFIAPIAEVLPLVDQAIAVGGAIGEADAPGTVYPNGIPAYFSRSFLQNNGVNTLGGFPVNMKGNQTPNAPAHSANIGLEYSWFLNPGTVTARWDYYWQDVSYGSILNSDFGKADSWSQHNASITFEGARNRWVARLWIRNIGDEDNIIERDGPTITLGEPRIYGISLRYNLGEQQ